VVCQLSSEEIRQSVAKNRYSLQTPPVRISNRHVILERRAEELINELDQPAFIVACNPSHPSLPHHNELLHIRRSFAVPRQMNGIAA
jgi:hypothetical protein